MWSTQVAGLMIPFDLQQAHNGCSARNALDNLVHLDVWYGSADRSLL